MSASGDPDPEVDKPVITTVRVETSRVKGAQPRGRLVRSLSFGGPYRSGILGLQVPDLGSLLSAGFLLIHFLCVSGN